MSDGREWILSNKARQLMPVEFAKMQLHLAAAYSVTSNMVAIFGLEVLITTIRPVQVSELKPHSALGRRPSFPTRRQRLWIFSSEDHFD